jgi:hypothetical protein
MARSLAWTTRASVFNDLLFRRRECVFFAFDLLYLTLLSLLAKW